MANSCLFCPFHADGRVTLLLHCEAEHTLRLEDDSTRSPPCPCGFNGLGWTSLKMHLWQFHGGGIHLRPEKCSKFRPDELRQLIALATSSPAAGAIIPKPRNSAGMAMTHPGLNGSLSPEMAQPPVYRMQEYAPHRESFDVAREHYQLSPRYAGEPAEPRLEVNGVDGHRSTPRRDFVCNLCERKCNTQESLHRHKREMHPTNRCLVYTCRKCQCEFVIKRTARLHMKEHGIFGAYDAFSSVRNARQEELPLLHCQAAGCPFRTSHRSLVSHDTHRVKMFAKITDQEWQEIRKGRYTRESSPPSPPSAPSPKERSPKQEALRKIDCEIDDGHIRIPAEGMKGRYVLVSADPGSESEDLIINIKEPRPVSPSPTSMFSSLLGGLSESGLKEVEKLLQQRHKSKSRKY
ncbi:hypothetical protein CAPTEDRAFT_207488 [Capitella teleta]|uniref:C2H2-type domain-containing protein n=1 Tax=Capitella teleta TaxID=283909 RepID=R7TUE5_CAPTE|nr:hypothetical protein CAPTEDRAFT_207488 [Capitella teleta]|eukprot:ELT94645.1 hypothetical protein CAPTEDRAFT_207488 [Capitella teleta]